MQFGDTALTHAASKNNVECVKWMLTTMSATEIAHQNSFVRLSVSSQSLHVVIARIVDNDIPTPFFLTFIRVVARRVYVRTYSS